MKPLYTQATLHSHYTNAPLLLAESAQVYERVVKLASVLRALDPNLPTHLRFVRRAPADEAQRNSVPFEIVFSAPFASGEKTPQEVDFWQTAQRLLPDEMVQAEQEALEKGPTYKFASAVDAALYNAFREQGMKINTKGVEEGQWVIQSTLPLRVPEREFTSDPDLNRWVYLAPEAPVDFNPRNSPALARARSHVALLKTVLSQPYSKTSSSTRQQAQEAFAALENPRNKFEKTHGHGWLGYALAHGGAGWTQALLEWGADPQVPYNKEPPMVWAVASNSAKDIKLLAQAGASLALIFSPAPRVFDPVHQEKLNLRLGDFASLMGFAATVGAPLSVSTLCKLGADVHHANAKGWTPLHVAASEGNEVICHLLLKRSKKELHVEDRSGALPSELVPMGKDELFQELEGERLKTTKLARRRQAQADKLGEDAIKTAPTSQFQTLSTSSGKLSM